MPFSRENALPIDELRRRFKAMQEPLVSAIEGMSPEVMAATVGSNVATFVFHECYHVGQRECYGEWPASRVW